MLQALLQKGSAGPLPAVMEAYARPTRIVRGKDVRPDWAVDEGRFEMDEERALWAAYQSVRSAVRPDMGIRDFLEVRQCSLDCSCRGRVQAGQPRTVTAASRLRRSWIVPSLCIE